MTCRENILHIFPDLKILISNYLQIFAGMWPTEKSFFRSAFISKSSFQMICKYLQVYDQQRELYLYLPISKRILTSNRLQLSQVKAFPQICLYLKILISNFLHLFAQPVENSSLISAHISNPHLQSATIIQEVMAY